jgi:hypothetical protein
MLSDMRGLLGAVWPSRRAHPSPSALCPRFTATITSFGSKSDGALCYWDDTCLSAQCRSYCCKNASPFCTACAATTGLCTACAPGSTLVAGACITNVAYLMDGFAGSCNATTAPGITTEAYGALGGSPTTIFTSFMQTCPVTVTAPTGSRVKVTVTRSSFACVPFNSLYAGLGLRVYDGPSTASPALGFICSKQATMAYEFVGSSNVITVVAAYITPPSYLVVSGTGDNGWVCARNGACPRRWCVFPGRGGGAGALHMAPFVAQGMRVGVL